MKTSFYLTFALIMFTLGCNGRYHHAIESKDELVKLSQHQNITNDNDRNIYGLITYSSDYKFENQFLFQKEEKDGAIFYTLKYDSIQLLVDTIIGVDFSSDQCAAKVCDYYENASGLLKPYEIKCLVGKSARNSSSPRLTMYFKRGGRLEYYPKGTIDEKFEERFLGDYKKIQED